MSVNMITIKNIEKEIKNQNILRVKSLNIEKGYIYSVLGHNGSGKSTLLKLLYNIDKVDKGTIDINNQGFSQKIIHKYIAYSPQKCSFLLGTLRDNFDYVYKYSENKDLLDKNELNKLLEEFELDNMLDTNIKKLSGGEQAKAQFIRTLIMNKDYSLFDEPMASIDFKTIRKVEEKILELKEKGKAVILVTHDFLQAKKLSDKIVFMENLSYIDTYSCEDFFCKYVF